MTEIAEDLEAERDAKNKAEKQKRDLNEVGATTSTIYRELSVCDFLC